VSVLLFTLYAFALIAPDISAPDALAAAIAEAAEERPIWEDDDGTRTAALLVSVAYWETGRSLDCSRVGDRGHSVSCFQLWVCPGPRCQAAREDVRTAARIARDMLAASLHACRRLAPPERLSVFTSGRCQTNRESRIRWRTHERLYSKVGIE
jgi:hypothetical protein